MHGDLPCFVPQRHHLCRHHLSAQMAGQGRQMMDSREADREEVGRCVRPNEIVTIWGRRALRKEDRQDLAAREKRKHQVDASVAAARPRHLDPKALILLPEN